MTREELREAVVFPPGRVAAFWAWTMPEPNSGCWLWLGSVKVNGYGTLWDGAKTTLAHRFAYRLLRGEIPEGMCACHRCDNPLCVNPDHIFLGTHEDNMRDRQRKGRNRPCDYTKHPYPKAKINWSIADTIRQKVAGGQSRASVSREMGVSKDIVENVANGRSWYRPDHRSTFLPPKDPSNG